MSLSGNLESTDLAGMLPYLDCFPGESLVVQHGYESTEDGIVPEMRSVCLHDIEESQSFAGFETDKKLVVEIDEEKLLNMDLDVEPTRLAASLADPQAPPKGWSDELLALSGTELSLRLSQCCGDKKQRSILRKYRRTLKNRVYAKQSRVKRLEKEEKFVAARKNELESCKRKVVRLRTLLLQKGVSKEEIAMALEQ
jgi:hypothetical protein